uniref:PX domain-containing protein n=1 Tax=Mucochytrium quahogii TaxID=96639 RepID=A0A7S2SLV3_9STRA
MEFNDSFTILKIMVFEGMQEQDNPKFKDILDKGETAFLLFCEQTGQWFIDEYKWVADTLRDWFCEKTCEDRHLILNLRPRGELPPPNFKVDIKRAYKNMGHTVYVLNVKYGKLEWQVSRRYREFRELHQSISCLESVVEWLGTVCHKKQQAAQGGTGSEEVHVPARLRRRSSAKSGFPDETTLAFVPRKGSSRAIERKRSSISSQDCGETALAPKLSTSPLEANVDAEIESERALPKFPGRQFLQRHSNGSRIINKRKVELAEYIQALVELPPIKDLPPVALMLFLGLGNESNVSQERVHITKLLSIAQPGDILLFKCTHTVAALQRKITKSTWDHVAIIVKRPSMPYHELLEATGDGVECYPLIERLRAYGQGFASDIALRRLQVDRTDYMHKALEEFTEQVNGKPYSISLGSLIFTKAKNEARTKCEEVKTEEEDQHQLKDAFFCSELVAEALIEMGVLSSNRKSSYYWPVSFQEGGEVEKAMQKQVCEQPILSPPIHIDCQVAEISYCRKRSPTVMVFR